VFTPEDHLDNVFTPEDLALNEVLTLKTYPFRPIDPEVLQLLQGNIKREFNIEGFGEGDVNGFGVMEGDMLT